jgi:hypothetical protein
VGKKMTTGYARVVTQALFLQTKLVQLHVSINKWRSSGGYKHINYTETAKFAKAQFHNRYSSIIHLATV